MRRGSSRLDITCWQQSMLRLWWRWLFFAGSYQNGELRDDSLVESAQRIDNSQRVMWNLLQ